MTRYLTWGRWVLDLSLKFAQEAVQLLVLLPPDRLDPDLEAVAGRAGLGDGGIEELGRHVDPPGPDDDPLQAAADEVPQRHLAAGVGEGDVEHGVELIAE